MLAAKSEINVSSRVVSQAETRPAIIWKPAAGGVEPFELWLVAHSGFVPNRDFPSGNRPTLRTVVVLQATSDVSPANDTPSGPPIEVPEDFEVEDEGRRVILFK